MTPEQMNAERAAFEAWAKADGIGLATRGGDYLFNEATQAGRVGIAAAELAYNKRREMQEAEQRLRAEIARLQAIADRGAHSGRHEVSDSRGYTCAPEKRP